MSKASDEIITRSKAIRELSDNPMIILQGAVPTVMHYVQTKQITRSQGIDVASRILAIIDLADMYNYTKDNTNDKHKERGIDVEIPKVEIPKVNNVKTSPSSLSSSKGPTTVVI